MSNSNHEIVYAPPGEQPKFVQVNKYRFITVDSVRQVDLLSIYAEYGGGMWLILKDNDTTQQKVDKEYVKEACTIFGLNYGRVLKKILEEDQ